MTTDIRAPLFPESITEGTLTAWHAAIGEEVARDALLVEVETDKVVIEIVAPARGRLLAQLKAAGDTVASEEVLGRFEADGGDIAPNPRAGTGAGRGSAQETAAAGAPAHASAGPAARKAAAEQGVDIDAVRGSGPGGRVTKDDIVRAARPAEMVAGVPRETSDIAAAASDPTSGTRVAGIPSRAPARPDSAEQGDYEKGSGGTQRADAAERPERRVPMTRLRASIARRLVEAQRTAAMLTTFNEVDMSAVDSARARYKAAFAERHGGARLGYMSFFVRAAIEALKRFPAVNASIDGSDVVYHGYQDIGVAVSTERGLVVPVLRDAASLGMAQIETAIRDFGSRARDNRLTLDDMAGGTFTISNGGVFGSLLSTPILNLPQTAILGLHKVQERPIALAGQVVIRPMMYLALSYDHRLIDGQEAVRFLVAIKEIVEDPLRLLLEV